MVIPEEDSPKEYLAYLTHVIFSKVNTNKRKSQKSKQVKTLDFRDLLSLSNLVLKFEKQPLRDDFQWIVGCLQTLKIFSKYLVLLDPAWQMSAACRDYLVDFISLYQTQ